MYKVGDVVLVNGTVENVEDYGAVVYVCGMGKAFFNKKELIPADKTYAKGLEEGRKEVWELVRKLGEIEQDEREKMFSYRSVKAIIEDCTIEEVMDRLEAYEKEKEKSKIKVGDVVECPSENHEGIVTCLLEKEVYIIWSDGSCGQRRKADLKKTGKHIDIDSLLRKIGE